MTSHFDMSLFVGTMALATLLTRAAPFLIPASFSSSPLIVDANKILPGAILTLLVIYSVKDTSFANAPHGIFESLSIGIVFFVHIWRRNALLSIFFGTASFVIFKRWF